MGRILTAAYTRACILAPFFASAKVIVYVTFVWYIYVHDGITAEKIFVTIAVYNPVRLLLHLFVPFAITFTSESYITVQRIQVLVPATGVWTTHHVLAGPPYCTLLLY